MLYLTNWGSFPQRKYNFLNNEERTEGLIFVVNDKYNCVVTWRHSEQESEEEHCLWHSDA